MVPEMSVHELHALRQRQVPLAIIDVRTPDEWEIARIGGARLIPLQELATQLPRLARALKGKHVVVYCHTGRRSKVAAAMLHDVGIPAYNLSGGIAAWSTIDPSVPKY